MNTSAHEFPRALVERSLNTADAKTIGQIQQWGQYHDSRLCLDVLAYLAFPEAPELLWDANANASRLRREALNLEATAALGATLALGAKDAPQRRRALAVLDLVQRRVGDQLPPDTQDLHVLTAHLAGEHGRVAALFKSYDSVSDRLRGALHCQEVHPRNGGSPQVFLQRLREFTGWSDLRCDNPDAMSIESLRTEPGPRVKDGPLISVIMTSFRPDQALLSAIRSIVAQTWQNWELLLVDDGSGPEYDGILRQAVQLDPRVKLLIQPENGGTYQARNRAMAVAAGEFITGLDSDDWAHPRRLATQARYLIDDSELVMVESRSLAVKDDLSMMLDPQVAVVASRSTLIMVRSKPIKRRIGFYDEVRKTADSEFRTRIKEEFGRRAWTRMKGGPLTLVRHTDTTLSAGEVARYWMTTSRLAYHSGFTHWHRKIGRGQEAGFLSALARPRPFPITRDITRTAAQNRQIRYDRIFAADWRGLDPLRSAMLAEAVKLTSQGGNAALAHCPDWIAVDGKRPLIGAAILKIAAEHGIDFVDLGSGDTPVTIPTAEYGELLRFEHPELAEDRLTTLATTTDPQPVETQARIEFTAPVEPNRLIGRRELIRTCLGLASVGAATAATLIWEPTWAPWVAAASLALWAALGTATVSRRLADRIVQ